MQIRNQSRPQAVAATAKPPALTDISDEQKFTRAMLIAAGACLVVTMAVVIFIQWHGV